MLNDSVKVAKYIQDCFRKPRKNDRNSTVSVVCLSEKNTSLFGSQCGAIMTIPPSRFMLLKWLTVTGQGCQTQIPWAEIIKKRNGLKSWAGHSLFNIYSQVNLYIDFA